MNGERLEAMVREFFPDADVGYVLWNHTAFPFTKDGRHYRGALRVLKRTLDAGKQPCETCSKPAQPGNYFCRACDRVLHAPESAVAGVPPTSRETEK